MYCTDNMCELQLKSIWIEPEKAAQRLAAHANSARSNPILWLIGIDEKDGTVLGIDKNELASWWTSVQKYFDDGTPELIYDFNLTIEGKSVKALVFDTRLAPYVSKISSGLANRVILWRDGTRTRAATRSEILKLVIPLSKSPTFEILWAELVV